MKKILKLSTLIIFFILNSNTTFAKTKIIQQTRHSSLVINSADGSILHQENASKHRYPASLTKMMTAYIAFESLRSGKINLEQEVIISDFAASQPKSNMNINPGLKVKLKEVLLAIIIKSANDMSVAIAETISGDENTFAKKMTETAHKLGMHHTLFKNASGLPNPSQKTTAHDMAKLITALSRDFPEYYPLFSQNEFLFKGVKYYGHNRVTKDYPGATGGKTGFINASGFNLVTSAKRGTTNLVGVVFGCDTAKLRDKKMMSLLDKYFDQTNKDQDILTQFAYNSNSKPQNNKKLTNKSRKVTYKLVSNSKVRNFKKKNIG